MKATCSFISGLCVLEDGPQGMVVFDALHEVEVPDFSTDHQLGNITDWHQIEAPTLVALCRQVRIEHNLRRIALDVEQSLLCGEAPTVIALLREAEELLEQGASTMRVASRLLVAPSSCPDKLKYLAGQALVNGLATIAALIDSLIELQPRLRSMVAHWFELPESLFSDIEGGRQFVWLRARDAGALAACAQAVDGSEFENAWTEMVFRERKISARISISRIAKELSKRMFPQGKVRNPRPPRLASVDDADHRAENRRPTRTSKDALSRALKQIDTIVSLIAQGDDSRARRFLRELVLAQTQSGESSTHAVKSLCNIAKQCADLYRTDFERECLDTALEIAPGDAWMLIQFGDHYKRVGAYQFALECFKEARAGATTDIVLSAIADVHAQMGDFARAIKLYKSIPGALENEAIRTAIADNLRRARNFKDAREEYSSLLKLGLGTHRASAGLAEIDKREGKINSARERYRAILAEIDLDDRSRLIYRTAFAGILVRTGEFEEAFRQADQIVQDAPFFMQAKVLRASILGLLGKAKSGLDTLSSSTPLAFGEWMQQYVRGLLLLLLDRYADARKELDWTWNSRVVDIEGETLLRMGAAVAFLENRAEAKTAKAFLGDAEQSSDIFVRHLADVLRYHIAVAESDNETMYSLEQTLASVPPGPLRHAVDAIKARQWKKALQWEVSALLSLAA